LKVVLRSGRTIELVRLEQWPTYRGMLCGVKSARVNEFYVERAVERAREWALKGMEPCLLPPPAGEELPPIASIAEFDSGELERAGSEPFSSVVVIWFQDRFGVPEGGVVGRLRELDWEGLATDWIW